MPAKARHSLYHTELVLLLRGEPGIVI